MADLALVFNLGSSSPMTALAAIKVGRCIDTTMDFKP